MRLAAAVEDESIFDAKPAPLWPTNEVLRKVYAMESMEALDMCKELGIPIPKECNGNPPRTC